MYSWWSKCSRKYFFWNLFNKDNHDLSMQIYVCVCTYIIYLYFYMYRCILLKVGDLFHTIHINMKLRWHFDYCNLAFLSDRYCMIAMLLYNLYCKHAYNTNASRYINTSEYDCNINIVKPPFLLYFFLFITSVCYISIALC